jgi:hypothetical protein
MSGMTNWNLEYRVWCHSENGAPDVADSSDYFVPFATYQEALEFSRSTPGAEEPLPLIRQEEYISEDEPGDYCHVKEGPDSRRGEEILQ